MLGDHTASRPQRPARHRSDRRRLGRSGALRAKPFKQTSPATFPCTSRIVCAVCNSCSKRAAFASSARTFASSGLRWAGFAPRPAPCRQMRAVQPLAAKQAAQIAPRRPTQSSNPIHCLECLIAVAFQMERRLDEIPAAFRSRIHAPRGGGDQGRSLIVFIENQDEILRWITILFAESVNPLDRLKKYPCVAPVRIVRPRLRGLLEPDIEDESAERFDLVEQPVGELPEFCVPRHVRDSVEARPLLFP